MALLVNTRLPDDLTQRIVGFSIEGFAKVAFASVGLVSVLEPNSSAHCACANIGYAFTNFYSLAMRFKPKPEDFNNVTGNVAFGLSMACMLVDLYVRFCCENRADYALISDTSPLSQPVEESSPAP